MNLHDASVNFHAFSLTQLPTRVAESCTYNVTHARRWGSVEDGLLFLFSFLSLKTVVIMECVCVCVYVRESIGITWDMSHIPSRHPRLNAFKMWENMLWNNLVFLYSCRSKSVVCSQAEHESVASASGISHSPVTLPQLSLPPVKGRRVSGPAEGQVQRAGVFSSPAASWCVVWFVLTGMWFYESQRAVGWC